MATRCTLLLLSLSLLTGCGPNGPRDSEEQETSTVALPSTDVVDLTYPFNAETIYWPTSAPFRREVTAEGMTDQGYYYASGAFSAAEHGGTHVDAPIHFAEGGRSVDEIPIDQLMGPAIVIDVRDHVEANPDYQIGTDDIQEWEASRRPIPDESLVFFRTGFGAFWPDAGRYMGTAERGDDAVRELHFPGLDPAAARWLLENRNVKAVGIDTPSIDYGQSRMFETHQVLAAEELPALENVANLDQLPEEGAVVVALPMKIEGGSGGPVRIVAFVP